MTSHINTYFKEYNIITKLSMMYMKILYRDSKVPKLFIGLNQMQSSPSFDWNLDKQNDPTAGWHQLHPQFEVLQQGKWLRYSPECVGAVTETAKCMGGEGSVPPLHLH